MFGKEHLNPLFTSLVGMVVGTKMKGKQSLMALGLISLLVLGGSEARSKRDRPPKWPKDVDTVTVRLCYGKRRANLTLPDYPPETKSVNVTDKALDIMGWYRLVNIESLRALEQLFNLEEYRWKPKWYDRLTVEDEGLLGTADYHFDLLDDDNLAWIANRICKTIMPPTADCSAIVQDILQKERRIYDGLENEGPLAFVPKAHYSQRRRPSSVLLSERFTTSYYYRPRYMQQLHQLYYLNDSSKVNHVSALHKKWQSSKKTVQEDDVSRLRRACGEHGKSTLSSKTFDGKTIALYRVHNVSEMNVSIENEVELLQSSGWQVFRRDFLFAESTTLDDEQEAESYATHVIAKSIRVLYERVRGALKEDVQNRRADYFFVWDDAYNFTHKVINNLVHVSDQLPDDVIAGNMAFEKFCFDWSEEGFPELLDKLQPEEMYTVAGGFCCRHLVDGKLDYNGMYQIHHISNETFIAPQHAYSGGFLASREKLEQSLDVCLVEYPIPHWYYSEYQSLFADIYYRCNWMKVVPLHCMEHFMVDHPSRSFIDKVGLGHSSSVYLSDIVLRHFAMDCETKSVIDMHDVDVEVDGDSIADID
eukprot:gb/GECG01005315.1/.p1 GENE.gb/GECG01005315.1/~~gb/GECG01005315.1/.p1  ORF type:complete len:590 (+),score=58.54 gb/GECG01005315.1/:1-1770(+)